MAIALTPMAGAQASAAGHPDLSGFWEPRNSLAVQALAPPAFTPQAIELMKPPAPTSPQAVLAINGIDETDVNCLPAAQPWMLTQSAPIDIIQNDGETLVLAETRSLPWRIYTDGRGHPDMKSYKPTLNGHSIGHWEGNEFVVDSVGFSNVPGHGPYGDLPHNPTLRVQQRFHLEDDGRKLVARFTVEDPQLFTRPYVYDFTWYRDPPETSYAAAEICDARDPKNGHY